MQSSNKGKNLEINSDQIAGELIQIKDRIDSVEAILAHANRKTIIELVNSAIDKYPQSKQLLEFCEEPRTLDEMQAELELKSHPAVHKHLGRLKDNGLLQHESTTSPVSYKWSAILRRLNKQDREKLFR